MRQPSLRNDPFFQLVFPLIHHLVLRLTPFFTREAQKKREAVLALVEDQEDYSKIDGALHTDWANVLCAILGPYALWDDREPEKTTYLANSDYLNGTLDVDALKKLYFESQRIRDFLIGMLFNPDYAEHYQAEDENLDEFYLNWLASLSDAEVNLIRKNLNLNQKAEIDRYLQELRDRASRDLPYQKLHEQVLTYVTQCCDELLAQENKAKNKQAWASARAYVNELLDRLNDDKLSCKLRLEAFFTYYKQREDRLSNPYTGKLNSWLDRAARWFENRFRSRADKVLEAQITKLEPRLLEIAEESNAIANEQSEEDVVQHAPSPPAFERHSSVRQDPFFQLVFPLICEFIFAHQGYFSNLDTDEALANPAVMAMLDAILGLSWRIDFASRDSQKLLDGLTRDELALAISGDFLLSEKRKTHPLAQVCLDYPQILNALIALLFNPEMNQYANEGQSSAELYLSWLNSLSAKQIDLLKVKFAPGQKIQLDLYLEDLPYWRAQKILKSQVERYRAEVTAQAAKAAPAQKQAWNDAETYADLLLSELEKPGTYKQRLDNFFAIYAKRGNQLRDPYTRKLDNFLARWWRRFQNWRRPPAYKILQNSIAQTHASLFRQVSPLAKIRHAIENYLEAALAPDEKITKKFDEIMRVLRGDEQTSEAKLVFFRKQFSESKAIFEGDGGQAQRFLSEIDAILNPQKPVVKRDFPQVWRELGF